MTKKLILLLLIATAVLTIISCTKKATVDTTAPAITITAPTDAQILMQMTATDSSTISAHITDEDLHAYSIVIVSTTGNDTLLNVPETHQEINDLSISYKFPLHVVVGTVNYKATVTAVDHSGNEGVAVRNFSVQHM